MGETPSEIVPETVC